MKSCRSNIKSCNKLTQPVLIGMQYQPKKPDRCRAYDLKTSNCLVMIPVRVRVS